MCVLQAEIFFVSPQESAALAGSGGNIFFQADKAILSALKSQITISLFKWRILRVRSGKM